MPGTDSIPSTEHSTTASEGPSLDQADTLTELLTAEGETVTRIGQVVAKEGVAYTGSLL